MRCKTCDYPLWQIRDRVCPECGSPFVPSDFEFTLNSVRFCCPHCEQAYYGTGVKGHLVPRRFDCVSCGHAIDMDEMVLLPTEGVTEHQTQASGVSWADRRNRGWFKAFFITMGGAMGNPNRAIDSVPEGTSALLAFIYMAIHVVLQVELSLSWMAVGAFIFIGRAATGSGPVFGLIGSAICCAIAAPLLVLGAAALAHCVLRVTGDTAGGMKRSIHAVCYSAGNNFLMCVPCLGAYLLWMPGVVWWGITAGFMLARGQRVRGWRAALAVIVPGVLIVGTVIGSLATIIYIASQNTSAATAGVVMPSTYATNSQAGYGMSSRLQTFVAGSGATFPAHAGELLLDRRAGPGEFILPGSSSNTATCTVQGMTLSRLGLPRPTSTKSERTILLADPNLGGPAHRVGDWVFTYAGISAAQGDSGLWLAIGWPDPALNSGDPTEVVIVQARGVSGIVAASEMDQQLAAQNALRAKYNLAPLPHPRQVKATSTRTPAATVTYPRGRRAPPPPPSNDQDSGGPPP